MNVRKRNTTPFVVVFLILVAIGVVSRAPWVAERTWRSYGTLPDLEEAHAAVFGSQMPTLIAGPVLERALEEARLAQVTEGDRATQHKLRSQMFVQLSYYALYGPLVLPLAVLIVIVTPRLLSRVDGDRFDFESQFIVMESDVTPTKAELPEGDLPWCPAWGDVPALAVEHSEAFEQARRLVEEQGPGSPAVSEYLAGLPLRVASVIRKHLSVTDGLSNRELEGYERAWKARADGETRIKGLLEPGSRRRDLMELLERGVHPGVLRVREELRRRDLLTPLRERGLRSWVAPEHLDHPASIDDHGKHAGGLMEHKADMLHLLLQRIDHPGLTANDRAAIVTMGVFHDSGKYLSYSRQEGRWVQLDRLHAQNTAAAMAALPEFWDEHGSDADRILTAVRNEHCPDRIPLRRKDGCKVLLDVIHRADGDAVESQYSSEERRQKVAAEVVGIFPALVKQMLINRAGANGWHVQGFYEPEGPGGEEVLVLSEQQVRQLLVGYLSDGQQNALSLNHRRPRSSAHPGFQAVAQALMTVGAIPEAVRGVAVEPSSGLISLRSGKRNFKGFFPVSIPWLRQKLGDEFDDLRDYWRTGEKFSIRILATGWSMTDEELTELAKQLEKEEREQNIAPDGRCPVCSRALTLNKEGSHLVCKSFYGGKDGAPKCQVRFKMIDGKPETTCRFCGEELVPVPRHKPSFMGCPTHCQKGKEKRKEVASAESA